MSELKDTSVVLSKQALQRMPYYLQHLRRLKRDGVETIAAPAIAETLNLNEVQVRKDFSAVSPTKGRPKAGFSVSELIENMENCLGYHNVDDAVLVGAGSLGTALLSYKGFNEYGMKIVMAFDEDAKKIGKMIGGKRVCHVDELSDTCRQMNVRIGIITVPADRAQGVCDRLVEGGILAIWNFAPVHLSTPEHILVQNENMASSLALLSKHLQAKINK